MSLNPGPGEPYLGPFGAISLPDLLEGNREEAIRFWEEWQVEEVAFFQATKPWELADVVAERLEGDTLWGV